MGERVVRAPRNIPPGAKIACENGHIVCEAPAGIEEASLIWPRFANWQQRERLAGEAAETAYRCDLCGQPWLPIRWIAQPREVEEAFRD